MTSPTVLNVLTGETGAGKSIIIGSINLALGQKSPKDVIRKGADYALVELTFRADTERQRALVEEMGISMEDDEILISRKIMAGRSVNRINGESVTLAMIRRIADIMIDIHGQNEQQSLLHSAKHMEIVTATPERSWETESRGWQMGTGSIRDCSRSFHSMRCRRRSVFGRSLL